MRRISVNRLISMSKSVQWRRLAWRELHSLNEWQSFIQTPYFLWSEVEYTVNVWVEVTLLILESFDCVFNLSGRRRGDIPECMIWQNRRWLYMPKDGQPSYMETSVEGPMGFDEASTVCKSNYLIEDTIFRLSAAARERLTALLHRQVNNRINRGRYIRPWLQRISQCGCISMICNIGIRDDAI